MGVARTPFWPAVHRRKFLQRSGLLAGAACVGCGGSADGRPIWIATTGHIHDAVRRIVPEGLIDLRLLCGPGVDPHSYAASARDADALERAELILCNGFHLEARMHDLLTGRYAEKTIAMADAFPSEARLDWVEDGEVDPAAPYDPHIWNHLPGWRQCVRKLVDLCDDKLPSSRSSEITAAGDGYVAEIGDAHGSAANTFVSIPKQQRVIVSAHDAFNYFARAYGFETVAVLGIGNNAEADIATMRQVADTVTDRKIPTIFLETITNPKVSEALAESCAAKGWAVKLSEEPLYSDALGVAPPVDTFLGAFEHNVRVISDGLTATLPVASEAAA